VYKKKSELSDPRRKKNCERKKSLYIWFSTQFNEDPIYIYVHRSRTRDFSFPYTDNVVVSMSMGDAIHKEYATNTHTLLRVTCDPQNANVDFYVSMRACVCVCVLGM